MKRLLALATALLLALACLTPAMAEDWRDMLRNAFGLTEDSGTEAPAEEAESASPAEDVAPEEDDGGEGDGAPGYTFTLPITDPQQIVNYLSVYGELPENFITKKQAKDRGWNSSRNYLGEVAPGMSIGGDRFGNYEGLLPAQKGRVWYECDANYRGKGRGAERVLFSSDGLYYYTDDHYKTFTEMFPEDLQ